MYWLEEPLPTADVDGYARLRAGDVAADRRGGDGAQPARGARAGRARRRRRGAARRGARGRHGRLPPDRRAGGPVRADVLAPHVVQRARAAREPAPRARGLDLPATWRCRSTRPAGRRRGATGCSAAPAVADRRRTGRVAPPARAGPRRRAPTSTRSRRTASHEDPRRRPARLPHRCSRSASSSSAPRRGRGARAGGRRRRVPSDLHLADGDLGAAAQPMVLGHEGAGVVEAVGEGVDARRAGRSGRVLLRPGLRRVPRRAAPAGATSARRAAAAAWAGTLLDGTSRLCGSPDGRPVQHFNFVVLLRRALRRPAASAVPIPARFRCGRRRCWGAAS